MQNGVTFLELLTYEIMKHTKKYSENWSFDHWFWASTGTTLVENLTIQTLTLTQFSVLTAKDGRTNFCMGQSKERLMSGTGLGRQPSPAKMLWQPCLKHPHPVYQLVGLKENSVFFFLNLDLISGMKYVYLLTENSLAKVGVFRKLFRTRDRHISI